MDCPNHKHCDPIPPSAFALLVTAALLIGTVLGILHLLESLP